MRTPVRIAAWAACAWAACACLAAGGQPQAPQLCEPWESGYAGQDATGDHVVALWQFGKSADMEDSSGHGHKLRLSGARIVPRHDRACFVRMEPPPLPGFRVVKDK